jgi:hypothetical protein
MQKPNHLSGNPRLDLQKPTLRPLTEVELWATAGADGAPPALDRNKRIME